MNDTPFTTVGDEPVEARIVAWVLGEASAFEVAELERLCEERPELLVFHRRMIAIHGLLGEATQVDGSWKLSEEKRKPLDEIFGQEKIVRLEEQKEKRIRRSGRRILLSIAACVVLTFAVLCFVPSKYESEAVIEVKPRSIGVTNFGLQNDLNSPSRQITSQFFGTEFEKIKSRKSLEKVVDKLGLENRWKVDKEAALRILKGCVDTQNISGTDLIVIRVRHDNAIDARDIADEVSKSYKSYREEIASNDAANALHEFNKAVRDQEDKVEERRKLLATIERTKAVSTNLKDEAIKRGLDAQDYVDARRDFETDQQLLQSMKLKQVSETVARRIPIQTVEVREQPVVATKRKHLASGLLDRLPSIRGLLANRDEPVASDLKPDQSLAKNEAASPAQSSVSLTTSLPAELIEGTPKPINVPNLESPVNGPAGLSSMAKESKNKSETSLISPGGQIENAKDSDAKPTGEKMVGSVLAAPATSRDLRPRVVPMPGKKRVFAEGKDERLEIDEPKNGFGEMQELSSLSGVESSRRSGVSGGASGGANGSNYSDQSMADSQDKAKGSGQNARATVAREFCPEPSSDAPSAPAVPGRQATLTDGFAPKSGELAAFQSDTVDQLSKNKAEPSDMPVLAQRSNRSDSGSASGAADPFADHSETESRLVLGDQKELGLVSGTEISGGLGGGQNTRATRDELRSQVGNLSMPSDGNAPALSKPVAENPTSAALQKAIREQEEKLEERRKLLSTIVRTKGIIYKGTDSFYNQGGVDEDQGARSALEEYQKLESDRTQLESQINGLLKYDSDQLMVYAAGLDLPDNGIRNTLPQYQETKRKLEELKIKGLGDEHPEVKAQIAQTQAMKSQLDEGVVNLRATLKAQLDLADNRLKEVEKRKNNTRELAIKRGLDAQDYIDAKNDFEKDQEILQKLKLKLHSATKVPEKPKLDLTKLIEEISASDDPYSTFSLNISDASFKIAQAALAKGERPDPAGIKVEQFYNAVDYGDPAPSAGEPVAVLIEQSAHPVIPGRNLVRVALKTAAAGRSASQALRLTLLVDQSGSMVREDRRAAMDKALAGLAGLLTKNDLVTVIGFSRTPRLLADGMIGDKAGKLAEIVNQSASEGGTNLEEAIKIAGQKAAQNKLAGAQNRIVLFTDGAANLGNADPARLAEMVKELRQKGIAFDIAGIAADGLNDKLLGELARNGNGRYYVVGKGGDDNLAKQLAGAFRPAAENVKLQVRFNPERVGRYKLIGFEKDRLKTEDFRNDAVDAAELAAEEAGVAIYQVETLPAGQGEIGEVSVRFRDAASAQMVERSWTIPHDAGVPAVDRATPSMQLAVLSMLVAEKLKGGPLGEAIDFKQFAVPRANVRQFYSNNSRVAEVLRMIDSL